MNTDTLASLERLLARGQDSAVLRFSLGSECLKIGDSAAAAAHLQRAVEFDSGYSAAWKLLGRALTECGRFDEAIAAYQRGIVVAEAKGDKQAAKEMAVFVKRLTRRRDGGSSAAS